MPAPTPHRRCRWLAAVLLGLAALPAFAQAPAPDLTVTKVLLGSVDMDGSGDINLGDELDYTVTATNSGASPLTNVVVGDDHYGGTATCATLAPGAACQLDVIYTVQPGDAAAGNVTNVGSATANEVPGPVTDTVVTPVAAPPPVLDIISGDGAAGYGGQSATLVVELRAASGVPMPGATITWNGAAFGSTTTDGNGRSSNTVSFNGTSGFITVTAAYAPAQVEVQFTLQSISATLGAVSGNNQSGPVGSTLPQPLVVLAQDDNTPVSTAIHWSVLSGDATLSPVSGATDDGGLASTEVTFGQAVGPVQVQAQRPDSGETAVFVVNATAVVRTLQVHAGNHQAGAPGATLPFELVVEARDDGVGADGVGIDFSVIGGGDAQLGTGSATTAGGGFAGTSLTLPTAAGPVQVRAGRTDDPTVFVVFDAEAAAPGLVLVSGDGQAAGTGEYAGLPLVVEARLGATPQSGITINWNIEAGDASLAVVRNPTDPAGHGEANLSCGTTPGTVIVSAARDDAPGAVVSFSATCVLRTLTLVSGDGQATGPGQAFPAPFVVRADDDGVPQAGVPISWSANNGTLVPAGGSGATDANGEFAIAALAGPAPGQVFLLVTRNGLPATAFFTAYITPAETFAKVAGDHQVGLVGRVAPINLAVSITDAGGNPVAGRSIQWAVASGDASLSADSFMTDAAGRATAQLAFGPTPGPVSITASTFGGNPPLTFTATAVNPTITIVGGDGQAGAAGADLPQPLVIRVTDGGSTPVPNVPITFAALTGGGGLARDGVFMSSTVYDTNAQGEASAIFHLGPAGGPQTVSATVGNGWVGPSVTFTAQATPPTFAIVSGNAQTTLVDVEFAQDLVVGLVPALADRPVEWSITTGSGVFPGSVIVAQTSTDAAGHARIRYTPTGDGPHQVRAYSGDCDCEAFFDLVANPVPPPTIVMISGDGQSGLASTVADAPLVVELRDGFGHPIAGQGIDFFAVGPGSVAPASVFTDGAGRAQVTLTFGAVAGAITIDVVSAGVFDPVQFTATSLAAGLGIAGGNGQSAPVGATLPMPLTVVVVDPAGSAGAARRGGIGAYALAGVPVTFTVASGGGSVSQGLATTDATGHASTVFTLGPVEGNQSVTASVPGGASITFNATAIVDRTLVIVSGDGQSAAPGRGLPAPLVVHAQDNGADAGGVGITWTVVTGAAGISPSGATDAMGLAEATATLGAATGPLAIRAERADDPAVFVVFDANTAQIQDIAGLSPEARELAVVIDQACTTLAGLPSPTPAQQDFLARCQDLLDGSTVDPGSVVEALDALLPGLALAMQEAAFNAAQSQFQNLKARIAALRSGTQGTSFQGLALNGPGGTVSLGDLGAALTQDADAAPPATEAGFKRWGFFAAGTIGRGEAEAGSTRPAYDYDINGLTAGLDYRHSDTFIVGAALGYTRQDMELVGQPGTMDMSGFSVSGYATWYRANSWYSDAVVTWGRNEFDLVRSVTYTVPQPGGGTNTIDQTARSQSDGDMLEAAFTFGRDFQAGGWSIGPYGRVLYTRLDFDRIVDEMDDGEGSGLGLAIDARSLTSVASEVGAKFTYAHSTDWGVVTPHLQLEWEHEFKDDPKALTARFLADPNGTPFSLRGEAIDTDYFRMSVGLSLVMTNGRSGFLIYERTVGRNDFFQDNLGFGIRIEF